MNDYYNELFLKGIHYILNLSFFLTKIHNKFFQFPMSNLNPDGTRKSFYTFDGRLIIPQKSPLRNEQIRQICVDGKYYSIWTENYSKPFSSECTIYDEIDDRFHIDPLSIQVYQSYNNARGISNSNSGKTTKTTPAPQ